MDRRNFLRLATISLANQAVRRKPGHRIVSVTDCGADATGQTDSTMAIRNAATRLVQEGAQVLLFPRGFYKLDSAEHVAISLDGYQDFEVAGSGSTLLMKKDAVVLAMDRCARATIRDFSVDWDPLPYTQGEVVDSQSGWFDLRIDDGFPLPVKVAILALESYDRSLRNIAHHAYELAGDRVTEVRVTGKQTVRVAVANSLALKRGTVIVIRFRGNHDAIRFSQSSNVTASKVNLWASPSMGYNVSLCRDLTFHQCVIGFGSNRTRLLSTNADGMHISNCSGQLTIDDCQFAGMGDDAINIHSTLWRTRKGADGQGAVLVSKSDTALSQQEAPVAGDAMEVMDPTDLHMLKQLRAGESSASGDVADFPIPGLVVDADRVPVATVSHCQFHGNHARAIVAHARLNVSQCSFQNISMAAILIAPDSHWMEGPGTENVVIRENTFAGCHYASLDGEGSITVDIEQSYGRRGSVPKGMAKNVQIISNTFRDCATAAITCRSVDGLVIADNQVGHTWVGNAPGPAILVTELTNSMVSGNKAMAANVIRVENSVGTKIGGNDGFTQQVIGGER